MHYIRDNPCKHIPTADSAIQRVCPEDRPHLANPTQPCLKASPSVPWLCSFPPWHVSKWAALFKQVPLVKGVEIAWRMASQMNGTSLARDC